MRPKMETTDVQSTLLRAPGVEPEAFALEESPAQRKDLTERVFAFADDLLIGLAQRPVRSNAPTARDDLIAYGIPGTETL